MNILLISECSKQALVETRRVLDQFAERKGQRTWQTPITFDGLATLRILLKKTARRNTAVACYRIYGKNPAQLLWTVGKRKAFNEVGTVPTQITQRNILRTTDQSSEHSLYACALIAGLAGLFHDFGKANALFQKKLRSQGKGKQWEPYRHEWISAQLFVNWVDKKEDKVWLTELAHNEDVIDSFQEISPSQGIELAQISKRSPLAAAVVWLIVSHHRLPKEYDLKDNSTGGLSQSNSWFEDGFTANWNSNNHNKKDVDPKQMKANLEAVCTFKKGTPFQSKTWRKKAQELAKRALKQPNLQEMSQLSLCYPMHFSRLALMLADHCYSARGANKKWQDKSYKVHANTDQDNTNKKNALKQQLDEHCIGVAQQAYFMARTLPNLRRVLPAISRHPDLKKRTTNQPYFWQNKAYDQALMLQQSSEKQGFFGVNMASTGKGKTFANARIMSALSKPSQGCRFSVALGLRALTLQTGEALKSRLKLYKEDIAVVVGSGAFERLYEANLKQQSLEENKAEAGSESEHFFADHHYVSYEGQLDDHYLGQWFANKGKNRAKALALVSAPISVSTIDYLMPACEGTTGGKQIAPMLRLLTSDLILDEPDDFGLEAMPALSRLVHWAGLLGSRVLLSSATLPPSLILTLFEAYQAGRKQYNLVRGEQKNLPVSCFWCDEFNQQGYECTDKLGYEGQHQAFIEARAKKLAPSPPLHWGKFLSLDQSPKGLNQYLAEVFLKAAQELAKAHTTQADPKGIHAGKTFSAGIIRLANIEPLVVIGRSILSLAANENTRIHYCFYHSQHPLAVRSEIEASLDRLLKRNSSGSITDLPEVQQAFEQYPEQEHIFIVFATPVAEVGRDHDYDWAIIEPSSMRSIIQLAGRVQRHRQQVPDTPNIYVLEQNYRALQGEPVAYCRPGFEADNNDGSNGENYPSLLLKSHLLSENNLLPEALLNPITSLPRFRQPKVLFDKKTNQAIRFDALDHLALQQTLESQAKIWWSNPEAQVHLFGEIQRLTPFRDRQSKTTYLLALNRNNKPELQCWDPCGEEFIDTDKLQLEDNIDLANGVSFWIATDLTQTLDAIESKLSNQAKPLSRKKISQSFFTLDLYNLKAGAKWSYHPALGLYRGSQLKKN